MNKLIFFTFALLVLISSLVGTASAGLNDGLVGYWKFDDSSNLGVDTSSYGNNGTSASGYVSYWAEGKTGGAAKFVAGSNAGITIPNAGSLNFTGGITVSAWINLDAVDGHATVISKSDSSSNEPYALWASFYHFSGRMGAFFSGADRSDDSGVLLSPGEWVHVAMTYDGQDYGTIKFFVNGVVVNSLQSNAHGITTNSSALHIGASPCPGPEDFSGLMDEVRLYNRALSEAEIQELYASTSSGGLWSLVPVDGRTDNLSDKTPLILVHGIHGKDKIGEKPYWENFVSYFNNQSSLTSNYKLYKFEYDSDVEPVKTIGGWLKNGIDARDELAGKNLVILAHSMGGLVARSYMQEYSGDERIRKLITLATPHHGSPGANDGGRACITKFGWDSLMDVGDIAYWGWGTDSDPRHPNRADLRWDNYDHTMDGTDVNGVPCYHDNPFEENAWLINLNQTEVFPSKLVAYYGYIDPQNDSINTDQNRTWLLNQMDNALSTKYETLLGYASSGGEHQKALVASILLGEGLKNNQYLYNDGLVTIDSGRFSSHNVTRRNFPGYDHADMKDDRPAGNLFDTIASDLLPSVVISVSKIGTGSGKVTGDGINCGNDCSKALALGNTITLKAIPDSDSVFLGWRSGGCSGTGSCTIEADSAVTVTAEFAGKPKPVIVVTSKGSQSPGILYLDLKILNSGSGDARMLAVNSMTFKTLAGTGAVTYNSALSGSLPRTIGDLNVASSTSLRVYVNVPTAVKRFSITESGSVQDVIGTSSAFQITQTVFP